MEHNVFAQILGIIASLGNIGMGQLVFISQELVLKEQIGMELFVSLKISALLDFILLERIVFLYLKDVCHPHSGVMENVKFKVLVLKELISEMEIVSLMSHVKKV